MLGFLGRWFKVYKGEIGMFAGAMALLFLVRSADMIFNNYAETAFLKRFGVEYLPVMYMVNSLAIFFIMGFMTGLLSRMPGSRLLTHLLLFCGVTTAAARFLVPTGWDLVYPLMFVMKSLYEALLGLLFWNMANDLFNTRQSKRLFPLISAGGVCGDILAGFGTPFIARWLLIDNLLLVYLGIALMAAGVVHTMGVRYPTLLIAGQGGKKDRKRPTLLGEIRKTVPLMKASFLVKILIFMTFFPNVIIPIMNFQFNFVANEMFATEGSLVTFLGYFRGGMNVVSLVILLFVGRIYGRWGLPVALMFHPTNYLFVFLGFLLRFDIFAAMYARLSTNIIRTTLHKPATDILMGLIPVSQRAVLRPFLRGTVVRVALLLGSGSILISEHLFHPRYLSLVAIPCVAAWLGSIVVLKKRYSDILLDLVSRDQIDFRSMAEEDVGQLFRDSRTQRRLAVEFSNAHGNNALWYAEMMKSIAHPEFDRVVLAGLSNREETTQVALLGMLSGGADAESSRELKRLIHESDSPAVVAAALKTASRLAPAAAAGIEFERFLEGSGPAASGYAAAGLFRRDPGKHGDRIDRWLTAADPETLRAGALAAGHSGSRRFAGRLAELLQDEKTAAFRHELIESLRKLGETDDSSLFVPFLTDEEESVRRAALGAVVVENDWTLSRVIDLLGDDSPKIRETTRSKIENAPYHNEQLLIEALNSPRRRVREQIYEILDVLNIRDLDAYRFVTSRAREAYRCLAAAERLRSFQACKERDLLVDHFHQKRETVIENALRVIAAQDVSGQTTTILRGVFSSDASRRANGIEAIDERLDHRLSKILVPLLEPSDPAGALADAYRRLGVTPMEKEQGPFLDELLSDDDWIVVLLTLAMIGRLHLSAEVSGSVNRLLESSIPSIRRQAAFLRKTEADENKERSMENETTLSDKIILLRGIEIFEALSVGELAAVASVTEEVDYPAGEIVIREGDPGETLYLIINGEVAVIKGLGTDNEIELDHIGSGDYFGEMALFEDIKRTASIKTEVDSRLLILHKVEFNQIVREYPQIALEICKVLSLRIRRLHGKIKEKKG